MKPSIIFLSLFCPFVLFGIEGGFGDEYYKLDINEKRKVFVEKLSQMLDIAFEKVLKERELALKILEEGSKKGFRDLEQKDLDALIQIQQKYRIKNLFDIKAYQKKIDTIPKSMGIAQALVESATGTSRFTKEANNLFGEWTWGKKGLVPKKRQKGKTHKIRIFYSLQESVESYLLNLNRHRSYEEFRTLRLKYATSEQRLTGLKAIETLQNYSAIKGEYVKILRNVITKYHLSQYDQ